MREVLMWPRATVLGSEVAATMYIGLSHCVVSQGIVVIGIILLVIAIERWGG